MAKLNFSAPKLYFTFFILTILGLAGYLRLVNLFNIGIASANSSDVVQYWQIGGQWLKGNFTLDGFYRPGIYLINYLSLIFFGFHDYVIRLAYVILDLVSLVLVFLIAARLSASRWLALLVFAGYAFLPSAIFASRIELPHGPSITFLLLSLWFFVKTRNKVFLKNQSQIWLFLSGLALGFGAHIHPSLALFGPAYVFYLFFSLFLKSKKPFKEIKSFFKKFPFRSNYSWGKLLADFKNNFLIKFFKGSIFFSSGFFILYLLGGFSYGFAKVFNILLAEGTWGQGNFDRWQAFIDIFTIYLRGGSIVWLPMIFLLSSALAVFAWRKFLKNKLILFLPAWLIFNFVFLAVLILDRYYGRLTAPLWPLMLISIFVLSFELLKIFGRQQALIILSIFMILLTVKNLELLKPYLINQLRASQSPYRQAYDQLKDKVDLDNKLLIAPYLTYRHRKAFALPIYFSDKVVYVSDFPFQEQTLTSFMAKNKIRFVYFTKNEKYIDKRILSFKKGPVDYNRIDVDIYGLRKSDWQNGYSIEKEKAILNSFFLEVSAKKIFESRDGEIYELPKK